MNLSTQSALMANDRLAEIERWLCGGVISDEIDRISDDPLMAHRHMEWLIQEVKRLREDAIRSTWPGYPCTPAQWELSQGEIHDLRSLVASALGGLHPVEQGAWAFREYADWLRMLKRNTDESILKRFKRIMRRQQESTP